MPQNNERMTKGELQQPELKNYHNLVNHYAEEICRLSGYQFMKMMWIRMHIFVFSCIFANYFS